MRTLVAMTAAGVLLSTALASAQTAAPTPTDTSGATAPATSTNATSTHEGAFANLSPGNQKIARSLFEAQTAPAAPPSSGTTPGGVTTAAATTDSAWSLDQIAAAKQSGQGWGNVFKEMKAQGLVEAKNLGQVVSGKASPPSPPPPPPSGETTSGGTATAAGSAVATRPSGGRHIAGRGSEVTVTLGTNRDIVAASGPRSASRQGASGHPGSRSESWVGARGSETAGQHNSVIAGGRGSSVGAVGGDGGHGQGRGGGNGGGRGR